MRLENCRICKGRRLELFLDLGDMPLVNSFLKKSETKSDEPKFPLDVYFCSDCGMVQLGVVVPPEQMFKNYVYLSGISDQMKVHFKNIAEHVVEKLGKGVAVDVGGNDGTMMMAFRQAGMKPVNVEPATNIAELSRKNGIDTINDFWGVDVAREIVRTYGKVKAVTGTNVFAHINDLDGFLEAAKIALDKGGAVVVEFPYLVDMIENTEFDTVYHEHLSYRSVRPLMTLFKNHGMEIVDVIKSDIHGGSIRVYAARKGELKVSPNVTKFIDLERKHGLDRFETYVEFSRRVEKIKRELSTILNDLRSKKKRVAGYGAPAKGNVLMNYFGIGDDTIEYIVDKNPLKAGLYTPGNHIPVFLPDKIKSDRPDYILILAWNFSDEIMRQLAEYKKSGGKFIIPIPRPKIV